MSAHTKTTRLYLLVLSLVAIFAVCFVSVMGFLNYRTAVLELEEKAILRSERESVSSMETAISFGKSFENYYGMDEFFSAFTRQFRGVHPFVLDKEGNLLYEAESSEGESKALVSQFLQSRQFRLGFAALDGGEGSIAQGSAHAVFAPIHAEGKTIGYFVALYPESIYDVSLQELVWTIALRTVIVAAAECIALAVITLVTQSEVWLKRFKRNKGLEKLLTVVVLSVGIAALSMSSLYTYQSDYRVRIKDSISITLKQLEEKIDHVQSQGVDIREVDGLREYMRDRVSSIEVFHSVNLSEHLSEVELRDEESDVISFQFSANNEDGAVLFLWAEISDQAIQAEMWNIILVLLSTLIILMVFVLELYNLVELFQQKHLASANALSEKQVGLSLRFTGFLCSTAEYMCVPYAAMMIRASGESLFGLPLGVTAALPLSLEGLAQMAGMFLLPRFVKRYDIKAVLVVSTIAMAACNSVAFVVGSALTIVVCRALAGIAYAGFKQVSNYLITQGYETEEGRSENISQDNAGLLAGATCGAGLGAILSSNLGYSATFAISAVLFLAYLAGTLLLPWSALAQRAAATAETVSAAAETVVKKADQAKQMLRMIFSPEMLYFILVIGIPLNIGVMLCVTLIPAICQTQGISPTMLSYCYIANGLAGIYVGPALVSAGRKRFGLQPCIAFAFGLTAIGIFILHLPPAALMIVITSMVLGFLDGFGTPLVTDRFMTLNVVRNSVDESTALIFSVVVTYVLLTFAPMIAELMLLPGKGFATPMMAGAIVYAAATVLLLFFRERKKVEA